MTHLTYTSEQSILGEVDNTPESSHLRERDYLGTTCIECLIGTYIEHSVAPEGAMVCHVCWHPLARWMTKADYLHVQSENE